MTDAAPSTISVMRIGAIGHRPNRLPARETRRIERQCREMIRAIRDAATASGHAPALHIVSALAEGSDRIIAEVGLALGASLECLLPFAASEYAHDFAGAKSRATFQALLTHASSVLELAGNRNDEGAAYEAVGRAVLERSDVLIAVWNGDDAAGRGGTAQMVAEASARHLPVIWIHAVKSVSPALLGGPADARTPQPIDLLHSWLSTGARMRPNGKTSGQ
jgi:hypothetical protein